MSGPNLQRFAAKFLEDENGCWIWHGATNGPRGYGILRYGKRPGVKVYAHCFSYETFIGQVPDGKELDHICRQPRCVNPEHLEPVTHRVNCLRGVGWAAINAAVTFCPQGHHYSGRNLYVRSDGHRDCRRCNAERSAVRRARE